jgi:outer membrane murein-binding lipoprotein Lpp
MKNITRLMVLSVIIGSIFLSACAPPPPPVTKDQLDTAEQEAIAAEKEADKLGAEVQALEDELAAKQEELKSLKKYESELN